MNNLNLAKISPEQVAFVSTKIVFVAKLMRTTLIQFVPIGLYEYFLLAHAFPVSNVKFKEALPINVHYAMVELVLRFEYYDA